MPAPVRPARPAPRGLASSLLSPVAERYAAFRRDVRTILRDLSGDRPPPFSVRVPLPRHLLDGGAAAPAAASLLAPRALRVERIERQTADAVAIHLADPSGAPIAFEPGQFLTVLVALPSGETLRRAYSISSLAGAGEAASRVVIAVKRVRGGRASNHLNDHLREGDALEVLGPSGSFVVPPARPGVPRRLVLLAGGSGITPLLAIARAALAGDAATSVALVYGNRGEADILFREEIRALAAAHPDRLALRLVLSEPTPGWTGGAGLLDRATTAAELDALAIAPPDEVPGEALDVACFVCGPGPMMAAVREALLARGIPAARVHEERFSSPAQRASAPSAPAAPQRITIRIRGVAREVVAAPGQTLLEAGLAAGLPMPFSCGLGGCGACKLKLVSGPVESEEPSCLHADERAAGHLLACVSRASGPVVVEVG